MKVNEIFGHKPPAKAFGRKQVPGQETITLATASRPLSDRERELLPHAKSYNTEDDWADAMNPIAYHQGMPPDLLVKWRDHDTALRKMWKQWKAEGRI